MNLPDRMSYGDLAQALAVSKLVLQRWVAARILPGPSYDGWFKTAAFSPEVLAVLRFAPLVRRCEVAEVLRVNEASVVYFDIPKVTLPNGQPRYSRFHAQQCADDRGSSLSLGNMRTWLTAGDKLIHSMVRSGRLKARYTSLEECPSDYAGPRPLIFLPRELPLDLKCCLGIQLIGASDVARILGVSSASVHHHWCNKLSRVALLPDAHQKAYRYRQSEVEAAAEQRLAR